MAVEHSVERADPEPEQRARLLRVRVIDNAKDGAPVVSVNIPIRLAKWGMRMAEKFSPEMKELELDWDSISAMIEEGERGRIVDVQDEAEHKTVEVWVE